MDLHIHTTESNGQWNAVKILEMAKQALLKTIAITHHNTVNAHIKYSNMLKNYDINVITGIEISPMFDDLNI